LIFPKFMFRQSTSRLANKLCQNNFFSNQKKLLYLRISSLFELLTNFKNLLKDESRGAASAVAPDGSIISQGSYLSAEAEIGNLEHCLTTDLLNHLVFVQKVKLILNLFNLFDKDS
jgi:hypothetical protein